MSNDENMEGGNKGTRADDNKVSFEEKELEILRDAVDLVEKRKGSEIIQDPKVQEIISIVEKFISDKTHSFTIKTSNFPITTFIQIMRLTMRKSWLIFIIRPVMKM